MFINRPQAGQALSASFLAALLAELYRLGRVSADGSILVEDDPSGLKRQGQALYTAGQTIRKRESLAGLRLRPVD
jgi:hypothetical protein